MPIYEYQCGSCHQRFELLSFSRDEVAVECSACHSTNVRKLFSVFSRQTASDGLGAGLDATCGDEGCADGMCGCADFAMDD